jgi:hypothetical protein
VGGALFVSSVKSLAISGALGVRLAAVNLMMQAAIATAV